MEQEHRMSKISDERREVAERMRDEADVSRRLENELGQLTIDLGEVTAVFQDVAHFVGLDGTVRTCVLLDRIADLIDPAGDDTTFTLDEQSKDGEEAYPTRWWKCAMCGEETIMMYDEGAPVACPYCGAMVVSSDDKEME